MDVHGVIHHLAGHLGHVVLGNRGDDGRCLTQIQGTCGHATSPFQLIGEAANAGQRFLHPFKLADGHAELLAHVGVGAHGAARHVTTGGAKGWQRDAATGGEALHQHAPAAAGVIRATDDPVERNEHILAEGRAVQERQPHGVVAIADAHARVTGRDQRTGDADLFLVTQQFFRVIELERQPQHGGTRRQGDVALVPVQANAQHLFTLVHPLADDPLVRDGARIGARFRPGQGEAGYLLAVGQPRQPEIFLGLGAVMHQQLARAEGVGHHDGDRDAQALGGDTGDDGGVGNRRELAAAVGFRDDQGEEAFFLQIVPHRLRQVLGLVDDLEVVHHGEQGFDLVVDKGLLFCAQLGLAVAVQFLPVRVAAKQLPVPPDGAGLHGLPLGGRQGRQYLLEDAEHGAGHHLFTDGGDTEHHGYRQHQQDKQCDHTEVPSISLFPLIIVRCYTARESLVDSTGAPTPDAR